MGSLLLIRKLNIPEVSKTVLVLLKSDRLLTPIIHGGLDFGVADMA